MLISDYIFPKRSAHSFRRTVSSRDTVNEKFLILKLKTCVPVNLRPNSRVQVTPLARPVNRGVFRVRPVPSAVPISKAASGAPDADRWAALIPKTWCRTDSAARHHRASSGNNRTYFEHIWAYPSIVGHERIVACRIVYRRSHRPVWPVAAGMARRRIACRQSRRVRYRPSPDTA